MKLSMSLIHTMLRIPLLKWKELPWHSAFCIDSWELADSCSSFCQDTLLLANASWDGFPSLPSNIPVITAGSVVDYPDKEICSCACTLPELISEINRIFFQYRDMERSFYQAVYDDLDMQEVLDTAVPVLFSNLLVSTMDFQYICYSRDIGSILPDFFNNDLMSEITDAMSNDARFAEVRAAKEPFIYQLDQYHIKSLCYNIFCHGELLFRLLYSFEKEDPRQIDSPMLIYLGSMIQAIYEKTEGVNPIFSQDHMQQLLTSLSKGLRVDPDKAKITLNYRAWGMHDRFICICILPGSHNTGENNYYGKMLCEQVSGLSYCLENPYVICVVNLRYYKNDISLFMEQNVEFLRDHILRAGISNPYDDFMDLHPHKEQAVIALETGMSVFPTIWYHRFEKTAVDYALQKAAEALGAEHFVMPQLLRLRDYDASFGTEYVRTLKKYLDNHLNVLKTARDLFIVRGTMNFRLSRIRELTGMNLKDNYTLLYLRLSFRLLEFGDR